MDRAPTHATLLESWFNCELAMENAPSRASKKLKLMDSISSVSKSALISSWNKARGLELTKKPIDVVEDEDELIELELSEIEQPDEQPIEVSDDEDESIPQKKINKKLDKTCITRFFVQSNLIKINFINKAAFFHAYRNLCLISKTHPHYPSRIISQLFHLHN